MARRLRARTELLAAIEAVEPLVETRRRSGAELKGLALFKLALDPPYAYGHGSRTIYVDCGVRRDDDLDGRAGLAEQSARARARELRLDRRRGQVDDRRHRRCIDRPG